MREVVSLEDRETVGTIKDLIVDCAQSRVGHFLVSGLADGSVSLLAFSDIISIGDPYITIKNKSLLTPKESVNGGNILAKECSLTGIEMLSDAGDHFSFVRAFEFDPKSGAVTKLMTYDKYDKGSVESQGILFLSPEYVFVNVSGVSVPTAAPAPQPSFPEPAPAAPKPSFVQPSRPIGSSIPAPKPASMSAPAPKPAPAPAPAPKPASGSGSDDLSDLLIGAVVGEDVTSKDGKFTVKKGTTITNAILSDALAHDAALLLTMSVDI